MIMKKPALKENRFGKSKFKETHWTSSSKDIGEYIFRRISLDQSDKKLQEIRPRHIMSQLIIGTTEINDYVNDYLKMIDKRNRNKKVSSKKELNYSSTKSNRIARV